MALLETLRISPALICLFRVVVVEAEATTVFGEALAFVGAGSGKSPNCSVLISPEASSRRLRISPPLPVRETSSSESSGPEMTRASDPGRGCSFSILPESQL